VRLCFFVRPAFLCVGGCGWLGVGGGGGGGVCEKTFRE